MRRTAIKSIKSYTVSWILLIQTFDTAHYVVDCKPTELSLTGVVPLSAGHSPDLIYPNLKLLFHGRSYLPLDHRGIPLGQGMN